MSWLQITLISDTESAEGYENALLECGAASITCTDDQDVPVYEPEHGTTPLWPTTRVTGLFESEFTADSVLDQLKALGQLPSAPTHIIVEHLEDQVWERAWLEHFKPMNFGDRLCVCPWNMEPEYANRTTLRLDPGLAFGTGTHPTTHLCLEWLDKHVHGGERVCDYGCGSGILALASALLGAENVIAIDNDPQAIEATEENARRNNISEQISSSLPETNIDSPCDLVVANILAEPLVTLAPTLSDLCRIGGQIALSGILFEQAEMVMEAYRPWFKLNPPAEFDGWVRIEGTRVMPSLV